VSADVDLYDPDLYVPGVPHALFRRLRREAPVFWQELPEGRGFWALLKHADVMEASLHPETFSAARGGIVIEDQSPEQLARIRTMLLAMDPPEHGRLRRIVLGAFTPSAIAALEPWLRECARRVVAAAAAKGECEFVHDVAAELPMQAIHQILAIPEADRLRLAELGDRIIGRTDPDFEPAPDEPDPHVELGAYGFRLATERAEAGGSDLISRMLRAGIEGRPLDAVEFAALFVQIAVAANETTRTLLSGSLLALLEQPQAWRDLSSDPDLLPRAVEEMLRWVTPVHYFRRTATRDALLRGQRIREGDRVVLHYTSANFDEEVFDAPERFDIRRDPNPHLAFGFGEHFCLGARLARLEARIFFEELFRRIESAELVGTPRRLRSNLNNAWKEIPVRLTPRRRGAP
jgi:cytochrome P450